MRFLADMGVSMTTVAALRSAATMPFTFGSARCSASPTVSILKLAAAARRIVLTFDPDFGDLPAESRRATQSVVIFRLRDARPATATSRLFEIVAEREAELLAGVLLVVEDRRYRLRRLPIRP